MVCIKVNRILIRIPLACLWVSQVFGIECNEWNQEIIKEYNGFINVQNLTTSDVAVDKFWLMPQTPNYIEEGIPYITSKNVKNRQISFEDINYISETDYEIISKNRSIQTNDLLITMIGTIGESAFVDDFTEFYGQNMYLVRLDARKINKKYFQYYFEKNKNNLVSKKNASSQGYLKAGSIDNMIIQVPPLALQEKIVNVLDKFDNYTNSIESGLKGEIEKNNQRYEYWRDKLLSFEKEN